MLKLLSQEPYKITKQFQNLTSLWLSQVKNWSILSNNKRALLQRTQNS
jgi:hypothetical protein